jgi:hypothetical protein
MDPGIIVWDSIVSSDFFNYIFSVICYVYDGNELLISVLTRYLDSKRFEFYNDEFYCSKLNLFPPAPCKCWEEKNLYCNLHYYSSNDNWTCHRCKKKTLGCDVKIVFHRKLSPWPSKSIINDYNIGLAT